MARIVLGVTGSVASIRCPDLFAAIGRLGHEVLVVATEPSLYFFDPGAVRGVPVVGLGGPVLRDQDEWPGQRFQRGDRVLHIAVRDWAELLVVAPLDANTLAKFSHGLCDNLLTCLFRAWDWEKPVILAPAMNTRMWRSASTARHLRLLLQDHGDGGPADPWRLDDAAAVFQRHSSCLTLIEPVSKRLACGDVGIGAMAEVESIARVVVEWSEVDSGQGRESEGTALSDTLDD